MAVPIEYAKISPSEFLFGASRYANSKVIYYGTEKKITFATYKKNFVSTSNDDTYGVIPAGAEYRPDKISQEVYGSPDFWWKILEANKMKDIYEFKAGLTIRVPGRFF